MPLLYHWRHLGRSQVQNLAPARTISCGISMRIYPCYFNLCGRCIGWPFTCFSCERCNMSSINKRSNRVLEPLKTYQKETENCFGRETNPRPTRWAPIGSPQAFSEMDLWHWMLARLKNQQKACSFRWPTDFCPKNESPEWFFSRRNVPQSIIYPRTYCQHKKADSSWSIEDNKKICRKSVAKSGCESVL